MAQMNRINDCFVHGDADGIRSISRKASSDRKMDLTEKTFIIEECKRALSDME